MSDNSEIRYLNPIDIETTPIDVLCAEIRRNNPIPFRRCSVRDVGSRDVPVGSAVDSGRAVLVDFGSDMDGRPRWFLWRCDSCLVGRWIEAISRKLPIRQW